MDITIAVVTYNAANYIRKCLESICRVSPHSSGNIEILVIDGSSTDDTRRIVRAFGPRVRLVENPGRTIASNRNAALREARHPFIAFTDADCTVPPEWITVLDTAMADSLQTDPRTAGVGGGNVPPENETIFSVALGIALDSFLGSLGSVQGRVFGEKRRVTSLACLNVLYKKAALQESGGFDENLANMCEDADIDYRLIRNGHSLYFIPGADVRHSARRSLSAWCRAMYAYGAGRARIMRKHHTLFSFGHALALGFLPFMVIGSMTGFFWPWAWLVWAYFPVIASAGAMLAMRIKPGAAGWAILILIGTHFCYAAGLWRGLFTGLTYKIKQ